ncbi:MAG TPA: hypothetical protein VIV15_02845 [Anaerolineales bacterium]
MLVLAAAAFFSGAVYLIASALIFRTGFPLDDSWIHQTYARNLALHGEWSFRTGIPSAGSTAPLWSALLAVGYWLGLAPQIWSYFLGFLTLFGLTTVSESVVRKAIDSYRPAVPWVGIFMAFEWHMAWAAMSGMETLLHALLVTAVLMALMVRPRNYLQLGWLTGLSVWVRPDGMTLLGPVLLVILMDEKDNAARLHALERYLMGFGALFLPYLLFNLWVGGRPMPNTFYAKQAEYADWQSSPVLEKAAQLSIQLLVGPAVILLPGVIGWLAASLRKPDHAVWAAAIWFIGYVGLYVSRLPLYQHGRYIMPAMPIFFLWGLMGFLEMSRSERMGRYAWFGRTLWQMSLGLVTLLFVILGARSYGEDVAVIESEMVATAKWTSANLPAGALVAAHDIGALGYFDHHPLIDLAGLISPEAVPFIRDESRLRDFLDRRGADYLIAFPEFYPELTSGKKEIFQTSGEFSPKFGYENMVIYRWK